MENTRNSHSSEESRGRAEEEDTTGGVEKMEELLKPGSGEPGVGREPQSTRGGIRSRVTTKPSAPETGGKTKKKKSHKPPSG